MKIKELCLQKQTKIPAKKRWIFFIGFFLLLIALFVTTHNDSFYKKSIVKVTKVTEEFLRKEKGPNGEIENYSRQEITSISRNGENKGKKVILVNDYSSTGYKTEKYKKGDLLFIVSDHANGAIKDKITGVKRDYILAFLIGLFLWGLILVATKKGIMTILSVIINLGIFSLNSL